MTGRRDRQLMARAVSLAEDAWGSTAPNPAVGCVLAQDGRVIAEAATAPGGRPHAEQAALQKAGGNARGATAYVTMEPCAHHSDRGPPCAAGLAEAGVARVVIARLDPSERNHAEGAKLLERAGIAVEVGLMAEEAAPITAGWEFRLVHGRPRVTGKFALSIDGRIALGSGESQWLTSEAARIHAHMERARADMIIVGRGTLEADDPALTVRVPGHEHRSPRPIVLTATLDRVPPHHKLAARDPLILASPQAIDRLKVNDALLEGGMQAATAFLKADRVDRLMIYRAPILVGNDGLPATGLIGAQHLSELHNRWRRTHVEALGPDLREVYERVR
ncbi:MAG: bifunctional diaminohydroxyphosphoribosylaminopyrimidine deaminase/5-amino-6-(5-phosphoribosylamino)uracil reductase RibD [Sphingomonadaceae bacterium]|nr:bifunctional diaminohydroxyphosphoribosylaminopyrimidine deaminase/5-amino-6-(5-phosphoribosylamino)uracil reductase RibD [Sphingomonadaceae bacterium]